MKNIMRHSGIDVSRLTGNRLTGDRLTGWLCLVAVWLQVLLPVALHSTAMADIPSLIVFAADEADDDGCALEDSAGHHHDDDGDHDHPSHARGGCLVCQAMHFMAGGSAAPSVAVAFAPLVQTLSPAIAFVSGPHGAVLSRHFQARAPPAVSI